MFYLRPLVLLFFSLLLPAQVVAKTITLDEAEQLFLQKNLTLLASKFGIEASKGAAIQAGLWNNPNLALEQSITQLYANTPAPGYNTEFQIQQLFVIAKRSKKVQMAELDTKMATQSFYDALRNLKFELRQTFYSLYFLQNTLQFYDKSVSSMQNTVAAAQRVYDSRSILLSELLRLKTLQVTLEAERLETAKQINELQGKMRVLLGEPPGSALEFSPALDTSQMLAKHIDFSIEAAVDKAMLNRQDLKIAEAQLQKEKINLSLQKLGWLPDFALGVRYSKSGSYTDNYLALTLAFDLPFFDRQQGEAKSARAMIEAKTRARDLTQVMLENEVRTAFLNAQESDRIFNQVDPLYAKSYETLVGDMVLNYQKGNIGIIAFADFLEAFRTGMVQMNQLQSKRLIAFEELNYATGTDQIEL